MSPVYRDAMGLATAVQPAWFTASSRASAAATPATAAPAAVRRTPGRRRPIMRMKRGAVAVADAPSSTSGAQISTRGGWPKPGGMTPTTV